MNAKLILGIFAFGLLAGCTNRDTSDRSGTYTLVATKGESIPKPVSYPDLVINGASSLELWGHRGSMRENGDRFEVLFSDKEAEAFILVKVGYVKRNEARFWLEFTENDNCVVYYDRGARFFTKKGSSTVSP